MAKNKKDLPARSEANEPRDERQQQQQEEFDNRGLDELQNEGEVRNRQQSEKMRDSQQGRERMIPDSKEKESEADYREERKFPNIKR